MRTTTTLAVLLIVALVSAPSAVLAQACTGPCYDSNGNLKTTPGSGGGTTAITAADGAIVTLGAKSDGAWDLSSAATLVSVEKKSSLTLNSILTSGIPITSLPALAAGSAIVGKFGIDQTTPGTTNAVSVSQIGATTVLTGAGATGSGSQRVTVAQDPTTLAGSAVGTAGTPSANVVSVQGVSGGTGLGTQEASGGPISYAEASNPQSVARPANTTTYTANTGWNTATSASSPGYMTFTNICRANGSIVLPVELKVLDAANQTTKLTGILFLFNAAPGTVINDNATFSIASGDQSAVVSQIPFTTSIIINQSSGSSGATMDEETSLGREIKCGSGTTSLYGMIEVTNAYVPVSGETLTFDLKAVGAN